MNIQLPDFKSIKVLIVGDVMLDSYWMGDTSRISPEAPIPVVHVREQEKRPGGAGNVALNVQALGGTAILMSFVGQDENGDLLEKMLEQHDVHCLFQRTQHAPTITKLRVLSRNQQLIRLDFEEKPASFSIDEQLTMFNQQLTHADIVIMSDYHKGSLQNASTMIAEAKQAKIPVLVDPKQHTFSAYRGATLLTPNLKEFQTVVGPINSLHELEQQAQQQIEQNDLQALLITRGADGMSLIQRDEKPVHIPTQAKQVFDVTGAGDTVIASLASALAAGQSTIHAMTLANIAAGIAISKVGAATVSITELQHALHDKYVSDQSIVKPAQLKSLVQAAQKKGETIVMTNGCFDLLHAGHIAYLEEAKRLGDRLIVAVNDNDSVKLLKGDNRPINDLQQRMEVLAGLKAVDWVIPFSNETPEKLICDILPNILVKGGDYKTKQIAGGQCVVDNGGEVKILCFKKDLSSSNIINKIKEESK